MTVELEEEDDGTRLALTQTLFQSEEARDLHNEGWDSSLERLGEYLDGEGG